MPQKTIWNLSWCTLLVDYYFKSLFFVCNQFMITKSIKWITEVIDLKHRLVYIIFLSLIKSFLDRICLFCFLSKFLAIQSVINFTCCSYHYYAMRYFYKRIEIQQLQFAYNSIWKKKETSNYICQQPDWKNFNDYSYSNDSRNLIVIK